MFASGQIRFLAIFLSLLTAFSLVTVDTAEARRGGSFGSRGTRTFQTVPSTQTSPNVTAPVNRTMTNQQTTNANRVGAPAAASRPGLFSNGLLPGLLMGGLFGMLIGTGFGGFGGLLSLLFQVLLVGGLLWFFFGRRRLATAGGPGMSGGTGLGSMGKPRANPYAGRAPAADFSVPDRDLQLFERRLAEVQDAFSREDYAALREITTPEMMGYLSEELGSNASRGVRNEVFDVKLNRGSVAESWREGNREYATVALRYESRDVLRDRATGEIVGGTDAPTETTEIWTFVRERGGDWKLSAIQDA